MIAPVTVDGFLTIPRGIEKEFCRVNVTAIEKTEGERRRERGSTPVHISEILF